jgi:carbon storage regulator
MLVLQRKVGESITIGGDINVVVTRIQGGRVTLGLEAPKEVSIQRDELRPPRLVRRNETVRPR